MAFAMAVNNLVDALKETGCPICRIGRLGAKRALESFLWENVNEPDVRQGILDAYGFCPAHSRVMVAQEISTSSIPLGANIIYEHLGRVVAGELKGLRPGTASGALRGLFRQPGKRSGPLYPRGACPACTSEANAASNSLHVLCEELERQHKEGDVRDHYLASDGICLAHIRDASEQHAARFPKAVALLIDDTVRRLESQSRDMKEYIRKNNWTYRDEKLTEDEDTAWRKTLAFFTGLPGESFTYKTDE